jgi:hypothetical protein
VRLGNPDLFSFARGPIFQIGLHFIPDPETTAMGQCGGFSFTLDTTYTSQEEEEEEEEKEKASPALDTILAHPCREDRARPTSICTYTCT